MHTQFSAPPGQDLLNVTTLGYAPMDGVHLEFERLMQHALACSDTELSQQMELLSCHLQSHLDAENRWMEESDFPARECHVQEHAAVLLSIEEVYPLVSAGDTTLGRRLISELAKWFPAHADYLDSALAHWMCTREFGGKPIVVHRTHRTDRVATDG